MSNDRLRVSEPLVQAAILHFLEGRKRRGASRDAIDQALADEWGSEEVARALRELESRGEAVVWSRNWYALRYVDLEVGSVSLLERGDAVIRTGSRGEPGLFVRRRNLKGASDGDTVLLRRASTRKERRAGPGLLPEASVQRVLARRHPRIVGCVEERDGARWLIPFDRRSRGELRLQRAESARVGDYVVADLPAGAGRGSAQAHLREVLGQPEAPGVDVLVVLRHFGIPEEFPPEVEAASQSLPEDPDPAVHFDREDLRARTVVTIDGETARDFDDAISVDRRADGGFELGVHIADVSAYVEEGSGLDREAYRRGTSVYYPERAIPMLPERLSNGLCSLRPGRPRLALSVFLTYDRQGELRHRRFAETLITSRRRLTYTEVFDLLEQQGRADPDVPQVEPEVRELLVNARSLMESLWHRRLERGSIDFDLPEGDVILDAAGCTVGVRPEQRTIAHRIIEEFMIAANEAVATELFGHDLAALYRIHPAPDPRDLEELRWILRELGIELAGDLESLHPRVLQGLLRRVEGRPEEPFIASLVLRSMQRAIYHQESLGHYALSSAHYLHFTSPIRRYPDLLVHRQLKVAMGAGASDPPRQAELRRRALPTMAEHCSTTERRAEQSERTLLRWKVVRFLANRVGETFRGRITGIQPFGAFVQLVEYYVDGLLPIRSLTDDFYQFEAENHRLVGRSSGRRLQLADEVEVVLTAVDPVRRGLELRLADLE